MRAIILCFFVVMGGMLFGQTVKEDKAKKDIKPAPVVYDTVFMLGGKKIAANIQQVGGKELTYNIPSKPDSLIRVERKQVEKIIYRTGRLEVYNKPVLIMVDEGQWQAVTITRDSKQIQGLYKRGLVAAKSPANPKSKKAAQQSAVIRLQKKAASQGGSVILITHEETFGGYGDIPGVYIEGTTYGDKPLETGTNVIVDKDKHP